MPVPDGHARDGAYLGQPAELHSRLHAGADHGNSANLFRCQIPRHDAPRASGSQVAEVAIVQQQAGNLAVVRIEDEHHTVGHGQPDLRIAVEPAHELEREVLGAVNMRSLHMDLGVDSRDLEADRRRLCDRTAPQRLERTLNSINGDRHVDAVANLLFR